MLSDSNIAARKEFSLRGTATSEWQRDHEVFYHHKQKPIKIDQANLFPITECYKHSTCVCRKPDILHFNSKFVKKMKLVFQKTKQKVSEQRMLLENAEIVLRISPLTYSDDFPVDASHVHYLHMAYTNFQIWAPTVMKLVKTSNCNKYGYLQLAPACCVEFGRVEDRGIRGARARVIVGKNQSDSPQMRLLETMGIFIVIVIVIDSNCFKDCRCHSHSHNIRS